VEGNYVIKALGKEARAILGFCVTPFVAFLTGKWPHIDGRLSKKYSF